MPAKNQHKPNAGSPLSQAEIQGLVGLLLSSRIWISKREGRFSGAHAQADCRVIVLFRSLLFHSMVPFISDEERHCIAFDMLPGEAR